MEDLLAARLQMALSLGFHIIFACIGMTMPFFMAVAEWRWLKTKDPAWRDLARAWSRGVAVFFAVGAVSGTVLSFELGLLWPRFMEHAGPIIGMPFSWEGTAFFLEAIALGLYLYGWDRLSPRVHWGAGIAVGLTGVASGVLVVSANGFMNAPRGFRWDAAAGQAFDVDPIAAMFNEAWFPQALHMVLAAFAATGFAVAGVHAWRLRRDPSLRVHRLAMQIALGFGVVAALLQPLSGDISAKHVARHQPAKLAAMEAHYHTEKGADLIVGGIPDDETQTVKWAIHLPNMLSFLAHGDFDAEVLGLEEFPPDARPPVAITHFAFQIMVGSGMAMIGIGLGFVLARRFRPQWANHPRALLVLALATPLGFIGVEAGWTVTEVGRQPWILYGVMRTADAVTPMPGLQWSLLFAAAIYTALWAMVFAIFRRLILAFEAEQRGRS